MTEDPDPASGWGLDSDRLREVLEGAYQEIEEGRVPDFEGLAGGDADLARFAERLVVQSQATTARLRMRGEPDQGEGERSVQGFGEYGIEGLLGSGGMSLVYLARQPSLNRFVALKVLDAKLAADETRRSRFRREAEIAASVVHPSIVPIYGVGEDRGRPFIAMKLLRGPTLAAIEKPCPARRVAELGVQLASALHTAHLNGIIHRDLKPSNIIVEGNCPVLLDFGLAWAFGTPELTAPGSAPGTLLYMSPEQLEGSRGLDPRTDVYSLGATLFELLHGQPIFWDESPAAVIERIKSHEPPRLRLDRADRDLETILSRAVAKDRSDRYQSAAELEDDLVRFLNREPILARRGAWTRRFRSLARSHPRAVGAGATLLLVLIALFSNHLVRQADLKAERARILDQVEREVSRNNIEVASTLLRQLGADSSPDLAARIERLRDDEYLMDVVLDFGNPHDKDRLEAVLARSIGEVTSSPSRLDTMAYVCATYLVAGKKAALEALGPASEVAETSRAEQVWRVFLTDAERPKSWVQARGASPSERAADHLLAARAMCLMRTDLREREAEVDAAFRLQPGHFGARHFAGRLAFEAGDHDRSLAFYRGCDRRGRLPEFAERSIARCLIALGRLDEAELMVARMSEISSPKSQLRLELELAAHRDDDARFEAFFAEARKVWPEDAEISILAATRAFNAGAFERARELAGEAERQSLEPRARVELSILTASLSLQSAELSATSASRSSADEIEAMLEDALNEMEAARKEMAVGERVSSDFELVKIRLLLQLGERGAAIPMLSALADDEPEDLAVQILVATLIDAAQAQNQRLGSRRLDRPEDAQLPSLATTTARLRRVLQDPPEHPGILWQSAAFLHLRLCFWLEDWPAFDAAVALFDKHGADLDTRQNRASIQAMVTRAAARR